MKLVVAIIRPFKFEEVKAALAGLGITGMTVTEAKSFGRQRDNTEVYRGSEYTVDFLPKLKVEFMVPDGMRDKVINALVQAAQTGKAGDGRIVVLPVDEIVRIRTGERAEDAL
ncbi:MAG: P-II family nitrogen regulator [Opitutales bacterium]